MIATYRLQLTPEQDFAAVRALVPYLRDLGISHLYLSPSLQARSGSTHGYDVVDPTRVSEALGGEDGLRALAGEGLQIVLDIVPNHMGTGDENRWWADEAERARVFDYDPGDGWYRRFFDIDDLAAVRVEDPEVFDLLHDKVLQLVGEDVLYGLRVDHPDGLADPAGYLQRLRDAGVEHVWVEKILHRGREPEVLRDWPVDGTVGYEFCNDAAALFVDPAGEAVLSSLAPDSRPFDEIALEAQLQQATTTFAREVERLRSLAPFDGIAEALAALPVYRTYVTPRSVADADVEALSEAGIEGELREALLTPGEFTTRFQQTSPPVTAKGIEDTAFYRDLRLLALNEVGGDPSRFGISVDEWHTLSAGRQWGGLLVTQTHDTKRAGDTRARIGALAGMAAEWAAAVERWRSLTEGLEPADAHSQYLTFQTLVGAWPISAERLEGYLEKALREAKLRTSWVSEDAEYEGAAKRYATALLTHDPFVADLEAFLVPVVEEGRRSALGQLLLKLTSPGVPDVYQGDELEDLSLVDPDNRRPVDFDLRRAALKHLAGGGEPRDYGERKLDLIRRALALRAARPDAFTGAYEPVDAGADVVAYTRGDAVLVVCPARPGATATVDLAGWREVWADSGHGLYERP